MTTENVTVDQIRETLQQIEKRIPRRANISHATILAEGTTLTLKTYHATPFNVEQLLGYAGIEKTSLPQNEWKKSHIKGRHTG
jgi:hypothetical protein